MRKILLVALTAAAMVSCSENEGFENESTMNRIKFGTVVKTGTKTLVATTENFSKFTVSAYKTTDDMGGTVQLNTGFMDDIEVDKSSGEWKYKGDYYWPASGKLQFFATSPAQTLDITTAAGYPKFEYAVKAVDSQEDLVAANVINQVKSESAISLPFQHLLTQVHFTIKGDVADFIYTVSKLVIKGAKDKATFTFDGSSTVGAWSNLAESASGVTYEYTGTPVSVTPTAAEPDAFTAFETSGNALFMLMPQDDLTGVTLEITYTAAPKDKSSEYTWNDTKVVNLTGSWGMGKNIRYTLTLTNNATPIKFTPNVGIWTNEDGTFTGL